MKNVKTSDFYSNAIIRNEEIILWNEEKIRDYPPKEQWDLRPERASPEYHLLSLKLSLFSIRLNNLIASYSRGDDKEELKTQFSECVRVMEKVWDKRAVKMFLGAKEKEHDVYYIGQTFYMRWMLSLAVLLEVLDEEFNILVNFIKRDNIQDAMYDICIKSRINDWTISDVVRPLSPKNKIIDIINENDKEICQNLIKIYLEKQWFKTFKNWGGWQSTDVSKFDVNSGFVGYWAFEVAAIVKIKGLDDSSFREHPFYPDRLL
ncbi:MAG: PoNe immunity protein domain-containing protein [Candidatus Paceibacterota bacterium]